jgi:hypothetical protein
LVEASAKRFFSKYVVVVGGLTTSTFLTLISVPVLYSTFEEKEREMEFQGGIITFETLFRQAPQRNHTSGAAIR